MEWLDWVFFVLLLVVSLGVGVFFRCFNRNMDKNDFLMASRNMSPFTVGMSIYVSFVSALSVVAAPGEVYKYGNALMWNIFVIPIVVLISCYTILPVFYRTKSESVYTYLELRFGKDVSYACLVFAQL